MTATSTDRTAANLATVADIYAAFGRGDVPTILDTVGADCRWDTWANNYAQQAGVAWLRPRIGPAGVADFFATLAELNIHDFQVLDLVAGEHQVTAEVVIDFTTPSGGRLRDEELHLWTLDEQQKIVRFRHYADTAKHIAAFAGEDTRQPNTPRSGSPTDA
jgi:ketosteroid isomerase-like protein